MSDQPGNTRQPAQPPRNDDGGWYVPGGATTPPMPSSNSPEVPLPTNTQPLQTGGWYVPPEAKASQPAPAAQPSPTPVAPPKPQPNAPVTPEPTPVAQTSSPVTPAKAAAPAPQEDDLEEYDYDNYVPGKGFVPAESTPPVAPVVQQPVTPVTPVAKTELVTSQMPAADVQNTQPTSGMQPSMAGISSSSSATPVAQMTPTGGGGSGFKSSTGGSGSGFGGASQPPMSPTPNPAGSSGASFASASAGTGFGTFGAGVGTTPPATQAPLSQDPPADKFTATENEVAMLRRVYKLGNMTSDDLRSQLRKLMVLDDTGNWWMIGMESDSWYKYDGKAWLQATPPGHAPRAPLNPEPSATVTASMPFGTGTPTGAISGTPLPVSRPAPIRDLDATMVGKSTPYLDDTLRSQEPRRGVDATVPSAAVPGYQSYTDADRIASPSPTPSAQPAQQGQPDYGMRPSGLAENSNQLAGCAARAAILTLVLVLGGTMLAVLGAIGYYYSVINRFSPEIDALASNVAGQSQTLRIKDAEGRVIAEINDPNSGKRTLIKLDQISKYAIHATVSTEDSRFYENPGFDIIGIVRAVLQNVASGGTVSGASSITQQLARALVFDPNEVTGGNQTQRKIVEIFVASEISRRYNKNQILEMYLNQIPYGNYSNGIEAASQNYFGKPAKDLNLAESALIAGLPQAPSTYNPVVNKEAAFRRMDSVLNLMQEAGCIQMQHAPEDKAPVCITVADRNAAVVQIARVKTAQYSAPTVQITYPHFVTYVLADLERRYGANNIYKLGYDVTTTLNPTLQNAAEQAVKNQVALLRSKRVTNGSVLAINPSNGAILAMVGSADFFNKEIDGQFNVVFGARQPGSSIKPFIYAGTLERDPNTNKYLTPASIFWDVPTDFAGYRPTNYDNRFRGPVSMRASLANSYNIPAVRALEYLTLDRFQNLATRFGLDFPLTKPQQAGLALALGGVEVSLYDMVKGYAIFANQGKRVNSAYSIQRITKTTNGQEQVIFDVNRDEPPVASQVIDPGIAYLVTNIMADNQARCAAFGCPNILQLSDGRPAAVKTGTTNNFKDNWTIGYTPEVVVGVWVGNSNGDPMINVSGIDGAAPIWNQVMTSYLRGKPVSQFPVPQGVAQGQICADYGTAADFAECPAAMRRNEIFAATNPPVPSREVILVRKIDTFSGKIANDNCPNFQTTRVYLAGLDTWIINWLNNTNEGRVWADNHGLTRPVSPPPIADCQPGEPSPRVALEQPASGSSVSSLVAVYGQVDVTNFSRYQLMLSQANRPDVYVPLSGEIRAARPSPNSLLGTWDTNNVPDGNYFLALKFWDSQDRTAIVRIPVIVNNTNPAPAGGGIPTPTPPFGFSQSVTSVPVSFPTLTPIPPQQLVTPTIDPFAPGFPSVPTATQPLFPPTLTPPGR